MYTNTKGKEGKNKFSPQFSKKGFNSGFDIRIINASGEKETVETGEGVNWVRNERIRQWNEWQTLYRGRRKGKYKHVVGEIGEYFEDEHGVVGWTIKHRTAVIR